MCSYGILPVLSKFKYFCFACIVCFILLTLYSMDLSADPYIPPIIPASQDATIKASVPNENRGAGTPFYVQQSFGLCSFEFSTQGFTPELGTWAISNGRYHVSAGPSNRISLGRVHCNDCVARVTARTGSGSTYPNNGFIIFDHVNSSNYKLAGFNAETGKWVIGEMVSGAFMVKATAARTFQQSTDYTFDVRLVSSTKTVSITLSGSQSPIVSYTFSTLNASRISLGTVFSKEGWFDDFDVFLGGPGTEAEDRALIKFDQSQIESEIGTAQLVQAKLWVYIEKSQWADSGHSILAHRLTSNWSENNVTWNCASDSNTSNGSPDCASQWAGGSFISQPTASVLHAHDQTGWVAFDVTDDVNAFLSGTANFGWLLKKNVEPDRAYGVISYTSRDGTPANTPNLMLTIQDSTPPTIDCVVNPSPNPAGWNHTDATVTFNCNDIDGDLVSCSGAQTISNEGITTVTGSAQDLYGHTSTTSCTVKIDKTPPSVSITSPKDGDTISSDQADVSGLASDATSGVDIITCNGVPAAATAATFTCTTGLGDGSNSINATATDIAGNSASSSVSVFSSVQKTFFFNAAADSWISSVNPNSNNGTDVSSRIQTNASRVLVQFAQADISTALINRTVQSATLLMYVRTNYNDWGYSFLGAHRITTAWTETGTTWNCPTDTNTSNQQADCTQTWAGGSYVTDSSGESAEENDAGFVEFDVTADMQAFLAGTASNFGWVIQKENESDSGSLDFTSRDDSNADFKPQLIIIANGPTNTPCISSTEVDGVSPTTIDADGTSKEIVSKGVNMNGVTSVQLDGVDIPFTIIDNQTMSLNSSFNSTASHQLQIAAGCNKNDYPLSSSLTPDSSVESAQSVTCNPTTASTSTMSVDSTGQFLCWNATSAVDDRRIRLNGYSGTFDQVTSNKPWKDSGALKRWMTSVQIESGTGKGDGNARGSNLQRLIAPGTSCWRAIKIQAGARPICTGFNGAEIMPYPHFTSGLNSGRYDVGFKGTHGSTGNIEPAYASRLDSFLSEAAANGIAVDLSLFDQNTLIGLRYDNNPWNPKNSDMAGNLPNSINAFPDFFKICTNKSSATSCDNSRNPLGDAEKNYVQKLVQYISPNHANVYYQVMNEATFDTNWNPPTGTKLLTPAQFAVWHATVAKWVTDICSSCLVSANVLTKHAATTEYAELKKCSNDANCQTAYKVFTPGYGIKIVSLHYPTWQGQFCTQGATALKFGKPVILDDDGYRRFNSQPTDNNAVKGWATNTCGRLKGRLHYYHTADGSLLLRGTDPSDSTPPSCEEQDSNYPDCDAIDAIANVTPYLSKLCGGPNPAACETPHGTYCSHCTFNPSAPIVRLAGDFSAPTPSSPPAGEASAFSADSQLLPISVQLTPIDSFDPSPTITLLSITADETLAPDDVVDATYATDDRSFSVKAITTSGEGRTYTATYQLTDAFGNAAQLEINIFIVP